MSENPGVTVAIALAAGMLGQALARHLRLPGIVLLLVFGALLGPDMANVVQPASLGEGLTLLVGFAVAVILFEGGMSLNLAQLRRQQRPIQQLITVGALVSLGLASVLAAALMGWDWQRSLLFGTLLIVTGPTVVTPLVRRLGLRRSVATVLEAEGVLIDAVGAITAAVSLELVLRPSGTQWLLVAPSIAGRLGFGVVAGLAGGGLLGGLLRFRRVLPEGMANTFALGWAVLVFQLSNALVHESGIAAVTVAGLVVGNVRTHVRDELIEFKEQLTVMLIGLLFVLLVADVRFATVTELGWPGLAVAAGCIVLVRPLSVLAGTWGTALTTKERVFVGWIGPRGIVAAGVASFFGYRLDAAGIEGGVELRALTFLVIAVTVAWSALTGGVAASLLGLRRARDTGWVIVGANALGRRLARVLHEEGVEVVLVDQNSRLVQAAERDGLAAVQGNALDPQTARKVRLRARTGLVTLTRNDEVNYLVAQRSRPDARDIRFAVALGTWSDGVDPDAIEALDAELLFGAEVDVEGWVKRIDGGDAVAEWWKLEEPKLSAVTLTGGRNAAYLPLVHRRGARLEPVTGASRFKRRSELAVLIDRADPGAASRALRAAGWTPIGSREQ